MFPLRFISVIRYLRHQNFVKHFQSRRDKVFSHKYLLPTNVAISSLLSALGDGIEQKYELYIGALAQWDKRRTLNMGITGAPIGVVCHFWYIFLDTKLPGRKLDVVLKKVLLDQLVCSPIDITCFFVTLGLLEKKTPKEIWEEMKSKAWKLYLAEWLVCPAAQVVNFYWLPAKYRVLYDNVISLGYDVYTSNVKYTGQLPFGTP